MDIEGKAAVITGAGSGIGRAMALALAERGARVIVADIDEAGGAETVARVEAAGGTAAFVRCDVTNTADIEAALAAAIQRFDRLDIVCNNAGIAGEGDLFDDGGVWSTMVDINLRAVIDGTRLAVRAMRGRGGVVINTASMGGLLPMPQAPVYAATKAGVVNFTRSLAYLAEEGIRVNAICPTFTETPLVHRDHDPERLEQVKAMVGGILQPEQVAEGLLQLVEDDSRAGAIMRVTVRGGIDFAREIRA